MGQFLGKGYGKRAKSKAGRNKYWQAIVNVHGYWTVFVATNLTEEQAFEKEIELIKHYKALGQCEANMTLGGEGLKGLKHDTKSREKTSRSHGGKEFHVFTIDKEFIGTWQSMHLCAEALGVKRECIGSILLRNSCRKTHHGYIFTYERYNVDWDYYLIHKPSGNAEALLKYRAEHPDFTKGRKHTEETRALLSQKAKEQFQRMSSPTFRGAVHTPFGVFENAHAAAEQIKISYTALIHKCASTKEKYRSWYFLDSPKDGADESEVKLGCYVREKAKLRILDTATGIIYNSLAQAAKETGISYDNLRSRLCRGIKNDTTLIRLEEPNDEQP